VFFDFTKNIHPEYPVKLQDSYLAIDYPDAFKHVGFSLLNKTKTRLIEKQGYNFLFEIEYISDYSYTNTDRNNRTDAMIWLANRIEPSDKIVIAQELLINEHEQRLFNLKGMYIFARSEKFKKLKQDDLIHVADASVLRALQRSPEFVYEEPDAVVNFFKTNKFITVSPEIIVRAGSTITEKWIADNFVTHVVGYDTIVVNDDVPFYDHQFRKSLRKFPLSHIEPIKRFARPALSDNFFYKEPAVTIYGFHINHIKLNLNNCEVSSKSSETGNIIALYTNGYVRSPSIILDSGTYFISLYAKGTQVKGVGPRIKIELHGDKGSEQVLLDEFEITSEDFQRYRTRPFQISKGKKIIKILFDNDTYDLKSKQDRNFYLKELLLMG
jgi:hypothetical protein